MCFWWIAYFCIFRYSGNQFFGFYDGLALALSLQDFCHFYLVPFDATAKAKKGIRVEIYPATGAFVLMSGVGTMYHAMPVRGDVKMCQHPGDGETLFDVGDLHVEKNN